MFLPNIEIYVIIVKYCCRLLELVKQGDELIELGLGKCIRLVNSGKKCWSTPVLYIFRILDIDPDLTLLHLIEKDNITSLVVNKLVDHFKEKFRKKLVTRQNLFYTAV